MLVLLHIIRKEFIQIIRNKAILPMMTVLPIIQMIILSYAANNEVKQVNIHITDQDHTLFSQRLIQKIEAVDIFHIISSSIDPKDADEALLRGTADMVLTIAPQTEYDFIKNKKASLQLFINAINGQTATVGSGYLMQIIRDFNNEMRTEISLTQVNNKSISTIQVENSYWYNPDLDYKTFMVPGILGELVTIIIILLSAMNVVREREVGTIEQINVSPIKKWQFILGKMIPFMFIGLFLITVGLIAGKLIFDIPMVGSLWVIFAFVVLNLIAVLGIGLLISNFCDTQQQAIFIAFFFVLVFVLLSGLFTPIESMPQWAQIFTMANPIAHFVDVMRQVLLKGSGFADVQHRFVMTAVLAVVFNSLAVFTYRKTV